MNRRLSGSALPAFLAAATAITLLLATGREAAGHGGRYRDPRGTVPPPSRDPGVLPSPPTPPAELGDCVFRWVHDRDVVLAEIAARRRAARLSPILFGVGPLGGSARPLDPVRLRELLVPALRAVAGRRRLHPDVRAGAVLALARIPGFDATADLLDHLDAARRRPEIVRESAVLGLGLAGRASPPVRAALRALAVEDEEAVRLRCFAVAALGMLRASGDEDRALFSHLFTADPNQELRIFALVAIGIAGDPAARPWLQSRLAVTGGVANARERAWIVDALGRIGDPTAIPSVEAELGGPSRLVAKSAWIALGRLVPAAPPPEQPAVVERLVAALREERDLDAWNLGLVTLGRIGGDPDAPSPATDRARWVLQSRFRQGDPARERPFAALGLGWLARPDPDRPHARFDLRREIAALLRTEFASPASAVPSRFASVAALGLSGDDSPETRGLLMRVLEGREEHARVRDAAALALGMIGAVEAGPSLRRLLEDGRERRSVPIGGPLALGLLGDAAHTPTLFGWFNDPKSSQFALGEAATALGWIGDDRVMIAADGSWEPFAGIAEGVNVEALTPALEELLSIL